LVCQLMLGSWELGLRDAETGLLGSGVDGEVT
jgi:hypothetical protein